MPDGSNPLIDVARDRLDDDVHRGLASLEYLAVAAFALDVRGRVVAWNTTCEQLTQVPAADVIDTADHWRAFHDTPHPCLADGVLQAERDQQEVGSRRGAVADPIAGRPAAAHWCAMPQAGCARYLACDAMPLRDRSGRVVAVVQTIRDLTQQQRASTAYAALGLHDSLTGLPNRRAFDRLAQLAWQSAGTQGSPLSVLMVDLDCFALYNDAYGHGLGDACLAIVAETISRHLSSAQDIVARHGGAKFAVLLPDRSVGVAGQTAERIRRAVADRRLAHRSSAAAPFVSVSIGVASGMTLDTELDQLFADAETALLRAKREGRNRSSASRTGIALSVIDAFDDRPSTREALRRRRDLKRGR